MPTPHRGAYQTIIDLEKALSEALAKIRTLTTPIDMVAPLATADDQQADDEESIVDDILGNSIEREAPNLQARCKIFLDAIGAAQAIGKRPTIKMMMDRRPSMTRWTIAEMEETIKHLQSKGLVYVCRAKRAAYYAN